MTRHNQLVRISQITGGLSLGSILKYFENRLGNQELASILNAFDHYDLLLSDQSDECVALVYGFKDKETFRRQNRPRFIGDKFQ